MSASSPGLPGQAVQSLRIELWDAGFRPVGVYNPDAGVPSAGKAPMGWQWEKRARRDPPEAVFVYSLAALNTGILCDGLRAIDIDIEDPHAVACVRAAAFAMFGETIFRWRENSSRCLLLYRATEGEPPKRLIAGKLGKVEVLGFGQQFVAFGRHPSGAELRWIPETPNTVARDSLPAVSEAEIGAFFAAIAPMIGGAEEAPDRGVPTEDAGELRQVQQALRAAGADQVASLADLPDELQVKLSGTLQQHPRLAERWNGGIADLIAAGRDSSRSGADFSLAGLAKGAGLEPVEAALMLLAFAHGEAHDKAKHPSPSSRLRYVARSVLRAGQGTAARTISTNLPAYFPAPMEAREPALARQAELICGIIGGTERLAAARAEVLRRRNDEIAAMGWDGVELEPAKKAAITRRHHRAVAQEHGYDRRLPLPDRLLISGSQGTGKTEEAYKAVAAIRSPMIVWVTEPTIEKTEEIARDYRRVAGPESLPARVVRGRGQSDPQRNGHLMCDRPETADRVAKAGLSVPAVLCIKCPFKDTCGSERQSREIAAIKEAHRGAVFFGATAQLYVHSAAPLPDLLIADDLVVLSAVEVLKISYSAMDPFGIPYVTDYVRERLDTLRTALLLPNPLKLLRREGFTRAVLKTMSKALDSAVDKVTPQIDGDMSDDAILEELDTARTRTALRSALAVVGAVRREIDMPRDGLNAVYGRVEAPREGADRTQQPTITVSRFHRPNGLKHAGVVVLDGTANEDLDRKLVGDRMRHERIAIERTAHIVGTVGRGYSRVSITGLDGTGEAIASRSAGSVKLRSEIETIRSNLPGHAAVFSTMGAIDALLDSGAVPQDVPVGHFAKLRGLNTWEHCRAALVAGAQTITIGELEDTARAFMADDPVPFISMDHPVPPNWRKGQWPYVATRMRRKRDGTLSPVQVEVHPDPRCQRVLEQIREADVLQAGDRVRPVFNQRDLIFLNNLALDIAYDEIRTHRELVDGGNRIELTAKQFGLLPLGARDLHRLDPDRYPTRKAAEHAIEKHPPNLKSLIFSGWGEFTHRVDGQPGLASRVLIDPTRHADPLAVLLRHFGKITEFQGVKLDHTQLGTVPPEIRPVGGVRPAESWAVAAPYARPLTHAPP